LKSPNFENCQVGLTKEGKIEKVSNAFASWVGKGANDLIGENFRPFFLSLEKSWGLTLPKDFYRNDFECFFPLSPESHRSSIGIHFQNICYSTNSVISLSPALAPHDSLKKAFMGDLMNDPRALANTLIRLQKAESRLSDYISNFPGIFFTQRPDMTFSYLSRGIKKLFPSEHAELARNGGLFLSKIFEKDRELFHKELNTNGKKPETFSFTYRISIPPSDQIIYLLDVRTPIITATQKLLGYDGVFVDITRQAIAEHRLSNSVWREGLATLTNGLVHDFSNLMAGIYSISELYHGMMEKDDPMAKGMGQIKKSAMQAQKLVRRIIDLHREKPASRTVHDLRLLLKDQMDLVDIIIPRSAKISTDFEPEIMPAFIEETGFRQVILNLVINARDAIERTGRIKLSLKKVKKGKIIMKGAVGETRIAPVEGAEISLSDNGIGIPVELQEKLFDPFITSKPSGSGSGFGLYNTKIFIEDHNGLIGFSTIKGKGTTFYLFIPLETEEEEKPSQKEKKEKRATRAFIKTTKN
jgi:two-component system cell cycle sensor histidine kinase/response regulator CckA